MDAFLQEVLQRPGNIVFPTNRFCLPDLVAGSSVLPQPTGHLVFYGPHGRRILLTDPDGHAVHECEWRLDGDGRHVLVRARLRLDWGRWVGLTPGGMVRETLLNLASRPGWQRLRADDLRRMAAQAMGVPLEEMRFFYPDEDLTIDGEGRASIRHRKDAFFVLEDGTFASPRFMACMGAMHWDRIDFLPVVELFQSLLPGTGSAAFELIRGLYDDQNPREPLPLRYRGIPPYPSDAAYRLFSMFFSPCIEGGKDPRTVFMDQTRSHEVTWLPNPDPPSRYFDGDRALCVTVKGGHVYKVTRADDTAGLSFTRPGPDGSSPCDRWFEVIDGTVVLHDGSRHEAVSARQSWGKLQNTPSVGGPTYAIGWRSLLGEGFPRVEPAAAYSAVLLYPDNDAPIEEVSSQPFVADHLQDAFDQVPELIRFRASARRVLVWNLDGVVSSCVALDRPRRYTVVYRRPEFAQKQAQLLWNLLARSGKIGWAKDVRFMAEESFRQEIWQASYELLYLWIPFDDFEHEDRLDRLVQQVARALVPGGLACLVGPQSLPRLLEAQQLKLLQAQPVRDLPSFLMHLTILPQARLKEGLTLFLASR